MNLGNFDEGDDGIMTHEIPDNEGNFDNRTLTHQIHTDESVSPDQINNTTIGIKKTLTDII